MPKIKVTLSIGIANARQEDVLEINDDEWNDCDTEEERQDLMDEYWKYWSNDYIDGGVELVE